MPWLVGLAMSVGAALLTGAYTLGKQAGEEIGEANGFHECVSETRKVDDELANKAAVARQVRRACVDAGRVWDVTSGLCRDQ